MLPWKWLARTNELQRHIHKYITNPRNADGTRSARDDFAGLARVVFGVVVVDFKYHSHTIDGRRACLCVCDLHGVSINTAGVSPWMTMRAGAQSTLFALAHRAFDKYKSIASFGRISRDQFAMHWNHHHQPTERREVYAESESSALWPTGRMSKCICVSALVQRLMMGT